MENNKQIFIVVIAAYAGFIAYCIVKAIDTAEIDGFKAGVNAGRTLQKGIDHAQAKRGKGQEETQAQKDGQEKVNQVGKKAKAKADQRS